MNNSKNKKEAIYLKKAVRGETPFAKIAGIVKIKEDISKYFMKKENGYRYVTGTGH